MHHPAGLKNGRRFGMLALALTAWLGTARADDTPHATATAKKAAPSKLPASALSSAEWQKVPAQPLRPGEIDELIARELAANKTRPAPLTTDEQFLRRATLDLTGSLPLPADVKEFAADKDPRKRAKLIDRLLESDEYARHWARYWQEVVMARLAERRALLFARPFEQWLRQEFQKNTRWDEMARAMLTARGEVRADEPDKNGAAFFLASHRGADAPNERAAETARVFLGIQIQCAQCHDHPFDQWKREQFHELAAYFARLRERPVRAEMRLVGFALASAPFGEHRMPGKDDPQRSTVMPPRFLDGTAPGRGLSDQERRNALAKAVTDKNNYWFAAAYVNRVWGVLMGQSFYEPVDDMGPQKAAVLPNVLTRVAAGFRATDYDVKRLFRDLMTSETYQRQLRPGESADDHLHFAAAYPTRLSADALWQSLVGVLGPMGGPGPFAGRPMAMLGPFGFRGGLEGLFKAEFSFDPSSRPDEVEGSIPQALLLMNNPQIHNRIQAQGKNLLARILATHTNDDEALRALYLRALARKPTDREIDRCRKHLRQARTRAAGFEDILWALINSTEFQTKR